jgi:hypothetical protein
MKYNVYSKGWLLETSSIAYVFVFLFFEISNKSKGNK